MIDDLNIADIPIIKSLVQDIDRYEKIAKDYNRLSDNMWAQYAFGRENDTHNIHNDFCNRFSIFWSNVQTLRPALFGKLPKVNVTKRISKGDAVANVLVQLTEQVIDYYADTSQLFECIKNAVLYRLINGRGTIWVRKDFEIKDQFNQNFKEGIEIDFVHYKDFGHSIASVWTDVSRVWRKIYLSKDDAISFFGDDIVSKLKIKPYGDNPDYADQDDNDSNDKEKKSFAICVYEIWCKTTKKIYFLNGEKNTLLKTVDVNFNLTGFFPCPKPLYATLCENSLFPKPDYIFYQFQAETLELLAQRQKWLIDIIKVVGFYDQSQTNLTDLLSSANGTLKPLADLPIMMDKGGLNNLMQLVDVTPFVTQLNIVTQAMKEIKSDIYEITGIADIIRGQGQSNVTATSENIKAKYATLRLSDMQDDVQNYIKDTLVIMAEMALQLLQPETIDKIINIDEINNAKNQQTPEAIKFLNDIMQNAKDINALNYKIDIETDSTVRLDQDVEKSERMEFVNIFANLMGQALQAPKEVLPLTAQVLKFAVRSFRGARELETEITNTIDQLVMAGNGQQQAPNIELEKQKIELAFQEKMKMLDIENQKAIEIMKMNFEKEIQEMKSATDIKIEQIRGLVRLKDDGKSTYGQQI